LSIASNIINIVVLIIQRYSFITTLFVGPFDDVITKFYCTSLHYKCHRPSGMPMHRQYAYAPRSRRRTVRREEQSHEPVNKLRKISLYLHRFQVIFLRGFQIRIPYPFLLYYFTYSPLTQKQFICFQHYMFQPQ
jgi:hypothetical protein